VCGIAFAWVPGSRNQSGQDPDAIQIIEAMNCPECLTLITQLAFLKSGQGEYRWVTLWPRSTNRPAPPPQVPDAIRNDYLESCLVFEDSPKASAALSRRCLQHILREAANVKPANLDQEIDEVLANGTLVSSIAQSLDAVRMIGNFAAHPMKSQHSGEVLDVLPGEAEWNLDVVEALMDVYFVQPAQLAAKKAALNAKLAEANKPQLP
jgi:hypothetical protein